MERKRKHHWWSRGLAAALGAALVFGGGAPAGAFQFEYGELLGNLDTTLSYGLSYRTQSRDERLIGIANGGRAFSVNADDGNLNYSTGIFSNVVRATSELELRYRSYGTFVRGTAFYDFENENSSRERTPLSREALDLVGSDAKLLDAFVWGSFNPAGRPLQLRLGEQVVSWGESTFIPNGLNVINPVDVNVLRQPGSELREAFLPEGMAWASLGLTENVTLEGLYLYDWDRTDLDPPGSYWSTNDFVGDGGFKVLFGFGGVPDNGVAPVDQTFLAVPRGADRTPSDSGQWGVALRYFAPWLNDTEFGFYFLNYHSRLPVISAQTGTASGAGQAVAVGAAAQVLGQTGDPVAAVAAGTAAGVNVGASPEQAQAAATAGVQAAATGGAAAATALATDFYARTARYIIEYPEDVKLFGISFNTMLHQSGIALQGEVSHRRDMPLQVDDVELLFAALGPINPAIAANNQVGDFTNQFATYIPGFILRNVTQVQATATKVFGPLLRANQFVVVGEAGVMRVHNMPDKGVLRLESPGTFISGNAALASFHGPAAGQIEPSSAFADATSWGYRVVGRLDYNNAIGAINLSPRLAWAHDVQGNSPGPGGPFLEGRKAITAGLGATYLQSWGADLSYTSYFGAGRYNLINDRDYVAFSVRYSF